MEGSASHTKWMSVETAMTRYVTCVMASDKIKDAWVMLMQKGYSGAPVLDDEGNLIGVLSTTDINRAVMERYDKARALSSATTQFPDQEAVEREQVRILTLAMRAVTESTVASIIPKDQKVLSLGPYDSLERAIKIMAESNINRLPVVKDNKVVGILTRQDIILVLAGRRKVA